MDRCSERHCKNSVNQMRWNPVNQYPVCSARRAVRLRSRRTASRRRTDRNPVALSANRDAARTRLSRPRTCTHRIQYTCLFVQTETRGGFSGRRSCVSYQSPINGTMRIHSWSSPRAVLTIPFSSVSFSRTRSGLSAGGSSNAVCSWGSGSPTMTLPSIPRLSWGVQ